MSYYSGDYYAGGYYAGGFFGNLFRGVAHIATGAVGGFLRGGVGGAVVGAAAGAGTAVAHNIATSTLEAGGGGSAYTPTLRAKHAAALIRGGSSSAPIRGAGTGGVGIMAPGGGIQLMAGQAVTGMRRMHLNRTTYVTRGGGTSRWPPGLAIHPKQTELVPSRRMNVGNARALRRAIRRVSGFGKLVKRIKRVVARANSAVGNVHRGARRTAIRRR